MTETISTVGVARAALEEYCPWHALRGVGRSKLVQATVLMPLFGYLIILNESLEPWLRLHAPWMPAEKISFSGWKIMALFYGTLLLSIASALFTIFAPKLVKDYESPVAYVASEHSFYRAWGHFALLVGDLQKLRDRASVGQLRLFQVELLDGDIASAAKRPNPEDDEEAIRLMTLQWHLSNTSHFGVRIVTAILFAMGGAMIMAPSVATIAQVTAASLLRLP